MMSIVISFSDAQQKPLFRPDLPIFDSAFEHLVLCLSPDKFPGIVKEDDLRTWPLIAFLESGCRRDRGWRRKRIGARWRGATIKHIVRLAGKGSLRLSDHGQPSHCAYDAGQYILKHASSSRPQHSANLGVRFWAKADDHARSSACRMTSFRCPDPRARALCVLTPLEPAP